MKLVYGDVGGTTFGVLWNRATVSDEWVSYEVPYSHFDCWWPYDICLRYGNKVDLDNVRQIEFAISNKPEDGDIYGSGRVIIDDVQGICPTTPEIRFTYSNDGYKFPLDTGRTVEGTAYNVPDDLSLWIVTVAPDNI